MYTGNFVFSQLMAHLPMHSFRRCVRRYHGNRYVKSFISTSSSAWPSPNSPTARACISRSACARKDKLYHLGLRGGIRAYEGSQEGPAIPWPTPTSNATGAWIPTC